jgi:hypothetical protein
MQTFLDDRLIRQVSLGIMKHFAELFVMGGDAVEWGNAFSK